MQGSGSDDLEWRDKQVSTHQPSLPYIGMAAVLDILPIPLSPSPWMCSTATKAVQQQKLAGAPGLVEMKSSGQAAHMIRTHALTADVRMLDSLG
eukprot:4102347-Amphidinium_carterae.1